MLGSSEGRYINLEEIRASFEFDRILGSGEVAGKPETSWDVLLDRGNEPFDISFPPVYGVHPSLTLKAAVLLPCDNQDGALLNSVVESEIAGETDAGQERIAKYVTSKTVSHLNDAVQHFQLVLDQCPVGHPDRAGALANLATTSPPVYIHESAQLSCKLLPLCPEGTYLRSIAAGADGIDFTHLMKTSYLRRVVLKLCPLGNEHHPKALDKLAWALSSRFEQRGSIDNLEECIQCDCKAISLCSKGHSERDLYLNNLALSLWTRFNCRGKYHDLDEAISLYEEALRLCPVGHESSDFPLDNLGVALFTRFNKRSDVNDINRAISLHREALMLRPPENLYRDYTLNNLALALNTRYNKLNVSEDPNEGH
ncbi:hypothetical protein F4604DRAFT_1678298 [Suillus subluteus]|nr:hypothetical protein F4604DRAFT_1678298 [Suillus subluteus]